MYLTAGAQCMATHARSQSAQLQATCSKSIAGLQLSPSPHLRSISPQAQPSLSIHSLSNGSGWSIATHASMSIIRSASALKPVQACSEFQWGHSPCCLPMLGVLPQVKNLHGSTRSCSRTGHPRICLLPQSRRHSSYRSSIEGHTPTQGSLNGFQPIVCEACHLSHRRLGTRLERRHACQAASEAFTSTRGNA